MSKIIGNDMLGINSLRLEKHMAFICPECGQEMKNQLEWREHLNDVHDYLVKTAEDFNYKVIDGKYYECLVCRKWLANALHVPTLLQYHRFNHLPYPKTYRCRHCIGSFTRKRVLCEHLLRVHPRLLKQTNIHSRNSTNDDDNELVSVVPNTMLDARVNKEFYMRFLCPQCGKLFGRFAQWLHHIDEDHTSTSVDLKMNRIACTRDYYCTECSHALKDSPTRDELRRHRFTHLPYPAYFQCSFCHLRKPYKTQLFLHYLKHHPANYLRNKAYVRLPEEWGGTANESTLNEIKRLVQDQAVTSEPETDLLQKALRESFINLEDELKADNPNQLQINHKPALDRSLNGYENVMVIEVPPNSGSHSLTDFSELSVDDLEQIYSEMFEEIDGQDQDEPTPSTSRPLKADKLQEEMQKYIHYLCPECGLEYDNQAVWRSHVFEKHNLANAVNIKFRALNPKRTSFLCLVCQQIQRTSKPCDLRRHHFQHMPYQSYLKCTICTKTKSSKPKMLQHLEFLHIGYIQKNAMPIATRGKSRVPPKKLQCLECGKSYTFHLRFKNHCRTCPNRLSRLPVGHCDMAKNKRLLEHLQMASLRIDAMLEEAGIDPNSIKLQYK